MLWFTLAVSVLTGILCGLAPVVQALRGDLNSALRESSARSPGGLGRHRVRSTLVAVEAALAVVLLAGATLMLRTYRNLRLWIPGSIPAACSVSRWPSAADIRAWIRSRISCAAFRCVWHPCPGLKRPAPPAYYLPTSQVPEHAMGKIRDLLPFAWVIRTSGPPMNVAQAMRNEILSVDRDQPVANLRTFEEVRANSLALRQFNTVLLSLFAGLALLLSSIDIYSVLSYAVSRRTPEIGLRMALGAEPGDVIGMVLAESLGPALAGIMIGLAGSWALTRLLESQLVGEGARDPLSFSIVPAALLAVSILASLLPVWRTIRVDPAEALRYE